MHFNIVARYSEINFFKPGDLAVTLETVDTFSEHKEDATFLSATFFLERQKKISVNASQEQREYLRNE